MLEKPTKVEIARSIRDIYQKIAEGTEWEIRTKTWPEFDSLSSGLVDKLSMGLTW